jgi:hypothetical protein
MARREGDSPNWGGARERGGRPKIINDPVYLSFRIEASERAALVDHCKRRGITLVQAAREWIKYLDSRGE